MKTDLFQSCGHCWVFQICWHIECSTFTASSFRIWNSSVGIPSLPLALFIVMLPKAHLTSHSRMSGSRWVITPSWLYGSWSSFFCTVLLCIPTWLGNFTFTFHSHALEKEMATHSSVLALRIPGTGQPDGLPSMESHRVRHDWNDLAAAVCVFLPPLNIFCFC